MYFKIINIIIYLNCYNSHKNLIGDIMRELDNSAKLTKFVKAAG